jgi:Tfp pilus assembly protein PilO
MLTDSPWKNGLILIAAGFMAIGYITMWFVPARQEIERLRAELGDKTAYIATTDTLNSNLAGVQRELGQTQAFARAWKAVAPVGSDLSPLFAQIHQAVRTTGAAVTRFEPLPAVPREHLRQTPVHMHALGTFGQIARALVALEKIPGSVWVDDLKFTQPREAGQKIQCEAKLIVFAVGGEISEQSSPGTVR